MEELIKAIYELANTGKISKGNVKLTTDKEGNITLKYSAPKKDEAIEAIKKEINEMDDDIFAASAKLLKEVNPSAFEAMASLSEEEFPNIGYIRPAYVTFKKCVANVVNREVEKLRKTANQLEEKYLKK